ncbi:MAG: CBS domain-containing protein [Desulfurococcales archaeon]|nr:CBS domain-containing protein [Desulfurococcales archaeon]
MTRPLTMVQREVLETLTRLYEQHKRMIKSKEVARVLGKDEGTVRNIIMVLKNMGLVESRTGPAGGYVPSLKAYEVLGAATTFHLAGHGVMIIPRGDREIKLSVVNLEIIGLFAPEPAKAVVRVAGNLGEVRRGDRVKIESSPDRRIVIEGTVERADLHAEEVLVSINRMVILPDVRVGEITRRNLITIRETSTLREAAKVLYSHGIRGAPIVSEKGDVIGFITTTDIAMVVANNEDLDAPVTRYMRRNVVVISEGDTILEAIRIMSFHGIGRLLVINSQGRPVGIVTRTDILRFITALR